MANKRALAQVQARAAMQAQAKKAAGFSPEVQRMTTEVNQLMDKALHRSSDDTAAIGAKLQNIRDELKHGEWLDWLAVNHRFGEDTAENAMKIARFSENYPVAYRMFKVIGPAKLNLVARLPEKIIDALVRKKVFPVPNTPNKKPINSMSKRELRLVLKQLTGRKPKFNALAVFNGLFETVKAMAIKLHKLYPHKDKLDQDEVIKLEKALVTMLNLVRRLK